LVVVAVVARFMQEVVAQVRITTPMETPYRLRLEHN
jgi:hypothetical protein